MIPPHPSVPLSRYFLASLVWTYLLVGPYMLLWRCLRGILLT